jgi:methionyl-tRNA synthetase
MSKFYITTPIFYVNDIPHIGHAYTTIVADMLARYHRRKGSEVFFLTGTDENSQKNVEAADKKGKDIVEYTNEMAATWRETWLKLGVSFDRFIRTTSPEHKKGVYDFFEKVHANGDIYEGDYEGYYCVACEAFITESDLVDGKCGIHKTKPEKIKEKNYFFKASKYRDQLLEHIEKYPEFVQPEKRRNEIVNYIKDHFDDFSITRQSIDWGIPLPIDDSQVIYVWFDALLNYFTGIGYGQDEDKFRKFWPADVQLVGKDIIKFHCALWPAMLLSAGYPLPKTVFAHGYFTIGGVKMSKSLGNVIDPLKLAEEYGFDAIRYFLLREIPFGDDGDFSLDRLKERYNADLANDLGNLVQRSLNMIEKFSEGSLDREAKLQKSIDQAKLEELIENFRLDEALQEIWRVVSWANKYIEDQKPWVLAKADENEKLAAVLSQLYGIIKQVGEALSPFLPETSEKIKQLLDVEKLQVPDKPLFHRKE